MPPSTKATQSTGIDNQTRYVPSASRARRFASATCVRPRFRHASKDTQSNGATSQPLQICNMFRCKQVHLGERALQLRAELVVALGLAVERTLELGQLHVGLR
jgi:hypothetical protein|eukprot:COSAG01_NODE_2708_length_7219_cov_2.933146_6_plen_103_part_00